MPTAPSALVTHAPMTPPWQKIAATPGGHRSATRPTAAVATRRKSAYAPALSGLAIAARHLSNLGIGFGDHVLNRDIEVGAVVELGELLVDDDLQAELFSGRRGGLLGARQPAAGDHLHGKQSQNLDNCARLRESALGETGVGLRHAFDAVR